MSFELLDELEMRVQQAVETIEMMKMEMDDLKAMNSSLIQDNEQMQLERHQIQVLQQENQQLQVEREQFKQKIDAVLSKITAIDTALGT